MMRGRFAPTPSGRMHIGNVYAMLAAWLSARGDPSGTVALRIEDVDVPRAMPDADRWIMDDLAWLGLDWDGAPVYQSQRGDIYRMAWKTLREQRLYDADSHHGADDDGHGFPLLYPCFCSRADIRAASAPQEGDGFAIYPGTCRRRLRDDPTMVHDRLRRGDRHAWRIAMPEHGRDDVRMAFDDRVFGEQRFDLPRDVGDVVLLRSDGLFSYQLAVVVDDLLMGVDDIVRGRDLLRSTALQIWIRRRLLQAGFTATDRQSPASPAYAHLPLVKNASGRRLAKRERSYDIGSMREEGVRPEQIIGYCAWMLGLHEPGQCRPVPMRPRDALALFSWRCVSHDMGDRVLTDTAGLRDIC